jgi:hypothetical protein
MKNRILLAVATLIVITFTALLGFGKSAPKISTFCQKVSDGYVLTGSEQALKGVRDHKRYAVTLLDIGGTKKSDKAAVKKALSSPSKHFSIVGTATRMGRNKVKITTNASATIDLSRPLVVFWASTENQLRDALSGMVANSCGTCSGVDGYREVACHDPNSIICCGYCAAPGQ